MEYLINLLPDTSLWWVMMICAVLIGFTKTSFAAVGTIVVPIMALVFGAKPSTGLLLPILCIADIGAIVYYRKSCSWVHLRKLLGWAVLGLLVAIGIDYFVPSTMFKYLMSFSILISVIVLAVNEAKKHESQLAQKNWVLALYGVVGGFATMIGNAAGPIMSVYLLSVRMPKLAFVGTSAWFFMAINYIKLPLQIWAWDNIHLDSVLIGLSMIPFIFIGSVLGVYVVKIVPEHIYRKLVIWITLVSALVLLF